MKQFIVGLVALAFVLSPQAHADEKEKPVATMSDCYPTLEQAEWECTFVKTSTKVRSRKTICGWESLSRGKPCNPAIVAECLEIVSRPGIGHSEWWDLSQCRRGIINYSRP